MIEMFFLIWVVVCLSSIFVFTRLLSKKNTPQENSLVDFSFEKSPDTAMNQNSDFETRLQKLENVKGTGAYHRGRI
jgi:hypothetical protein